jgi:hypothetical protein
MKDRGQPISRNHHGNAVAKGFRAEDGAARRKASGSPRATFVQIMSKKRRTSAKLHVTVVFLIVAECRRVFGNGSVCRGHLIRPYGSWRIL